MQTSLGITQDGLKAALELKRIYKAGRPIPVAGGNGRLLTPEHLLNHDLYLGGLEDPLALAMVGARDPESPMAIAAAVRLSPIAGRKKVVSGILGLVGETTGHQEVRECIDLVTKNAFTPGAITAARDKANRCIIRTRKQYTETLRRNLRALLDGVIAPRQFVHEFFDLAEAGNLRNDIRQRLVVRLLTSKTIRPAIKFLMLENFQRFPSPVRVEIVSAILKADPTPQIESIKEELRWIMREHPLDSNLH